jgi:hypothetical protein
MDHLKLLSKFKQGIDHLLTRSASRFSTRMLALALLIALVPTTYAVVVNHLQYAVKQQDEVSLRKQKLRGDIHLLKYTIAYLQLCIDSRRENQQLSTGYCLEALAAYGKHSELLVLHKDLAARNAIEAMLIDAQYRVLLLQDTLNDANQSRSSETVLLDRLLNLKALLAITASIPLLGFYIMSFFYQSVRLTSKQLSR